MLLVEGVAAEVASALHVETTLDVFKLGEVGTTQLANDIKEREGNILVESTAKVNGTSDSLKVRERNAGELVVASELETTVDGLEAGHAEVRELGVVIENKVTGLGQVGGAEGLEAVTPEAHLTGKVVERRNGNAADVTEGHVGTALQVRELDLERVHVTGEVDQTSGVGQVVDVDGLEVGVLRDIEVADPVEGDSVQAGQTGVGDSDVAGLGDTSRKVELLELRQSSPLDAAHAAEGAHAKGVETSKAIQLEGVTDGAQAGGSQSRQVAGTVGAEATSDLLDTVQVEGVGRFFGNLDVALEGLAIAVLVGISLAGDLDGLALTAS